MQFSINKTDLHHYDIFKLCPMQGKLFGKSHEKKYMGYVTISLDGQNVDIYCKDKQMKNYSDIIGKHTYNYYESELYKLSSLNT